MKYHQLACDAYFEDEQTIEDYEMGDFDLTVFWEGKKYEGQIPEYVRLYIREADENLPEAPLLANPVSWLIFSQKLLDFWWPLIKHDVQIFDAPVYLKSATKVDGYKLVNPICVIDCIDMERSETSIAPDGRIRGFGKVYIKDSCVGNHHIFRPQNNIYTVLVSDKLAKSLIGTAFRGIAFVICGESPQKGTEVQ